MVYHAPLEFMYSLCSLYVKALLTRSSVVIIFLCSNNIPVKCCDLSAPVCWLTCKSLIVESAKQCRNYCHAHPGEARTTCMHSS